MKEVCKFQSLGYCQEIMVKRECTDLARTSMSGSSKIWLHLFLNVWLLTSLKPHSFLFFLCTYLDKLRNFQCSHLWHLWEFQTIKTLSSMETIIPAMPLNHQKIPSSLPSFQFQTIVSQFLKGCSAFSTEPHYVITYTNLFLLFCCVCVIISLDIWTCLGWGVHPVPTA